MPGDEIKKGGQHVFEIIHVEHWYQYVVINIYYHDLQKQWHLATIVHQHTRSL